MSKDKILHKTSVGGQALIEGVMMNGPKGAALSVRHTDGHIITEMSEVKHIKDKYKFLGLPFIRGIVNFIESMTIGYKSLMRSAELSGQLDAEENTEDMSKLDKWLNEHLSSKVITAITAVFSVIVAVVCFALFFYAPTFLVDLVDEKLLNGAIADFHPFFEGIIKMVIVICYMLAVSQMNDIKRVFMYHGAEHKSIFCYEKGLELTVENVRVCRRFHPRCGTSFIFIVLITSVIISSVTVLIFPILNSPDYRIIWTLVKIFAILPVVTGISYELIKYAGRHDNIITKIFSAPGLWMQRITTKEPTDDMIEVAIASIKAVITDDPKDDVLQ
ncbi:MAG: DUF1385 domain-containing protein [Clostridia bacterium]|nr:DUF1385 domain-containing protein [Clostridia bacterium]